MQYDCLIIGGGAAGLSAGIYASRSGLKTILIEKMMAGGQANMIDKIENYPGYGSINGTELCMNMLTQAENFGMEMLYDEVTGMDLTNDIKTINTESGKIISTKTVIFCSGASHKLLGIKRENELTGAGISYCATCDGAFYKNKTVAVVGGGNTAFQDALYLSNLCKDIYIIHRRDQYRAAQILIDRAKSKNNIHFITNSIVTNLIGDKALTGITISSVIDNTEQQLDLSGVFVAVGLSPNTDFITGLELNDNYIVTDENMCTSVKGVFAAGDVRYKRLRQVVTAASDGASAAFSADEYIHAVN